MKYIYLLAFAVLFSGIAKTQPWMHSPYFDASKGNNNSFYDIQKAFYKWADGKDLKKIKGWKRFKRWEWFMEPRVDSDGRMPDPAINWTEWNKFKTNYPQLYTKPSKGNSNWVSIAPLTIPPSPDTLSIHGMGRINCIAFHPTDPNTLWICASQGGVWKTTDDGQTWACLTDDLPVLRTSYLAVDPANPDILYLATGDIDYIGFNTISAGRVYQYGIGIMKSVDGGATWSTTGLSFNLTDGNSSLIRKIIVNPANSDQLVAAGGDGIYRSDDAGATWTHTNGAMVVDLEENPLNKKTLYASTFFSAAAGSTAIIMKSTDFGDTWDTLNSGIPSTDVVQRIELAAAKSDTNTVYAITCKMNEGMYKVYKTANGGTTWTTAASSPNLLGWADGEYLHSIYATFPLGDSLGQGTYDLTLIVDPINKNKVYSGGVNMWASTNGGVAWDFVSMWVGYFGPSIHADQHYSIFSPLTGNFYQSTDGGIFKTTQLIKGSFISVIPCVNLTTQEIIPGCYDLPTNWTDLSAGLAITEYYRLGGCRADAGLIAAGSQDNGTYLYNNGNWISTLGGDGMEAMIDHYNPNIVYATNYNGALSKSTDGGITYVSSLEQPITDAGETGDWVTPFVMHPNYSNIIYTGFDNVWRSDDGGSTWTKISNFALGHSIRALAVATSDPNYIYAYRPAVLSKTTDGGATWSTVSIGLPVSLAKISGIAIDGSDPEHVCVSFSGYEDGQKVYETTDGGSTWTNISGILPNVAANCILFQDGTINGVTGALYVGTDVGVFYTNDSIRTSGTSWILYDSGLPNVVVNDLEIHYGAQKLRAATYGRGLWESDLYSPSVWVITGSGMTTSTSNFSVYPNPAKNQVSVSASIDGTKDVKLTIFAITGEKVMSVNEKAKSKFEKTLTIKNLPAGTYVLQIQAGNCQYTSKLVKE